MCHNQYLMSASHSTTRHLWRCDLIRGNVMFDLGFMWSRNWNEPCYIFDGSSLHSGLFFYFQHSLFRFLWYLWPLLMWCLYGISICVAFVPSSICGFSWVCQWCGVCVVQLFVCSVVWYLWPLLVNSVVCCLCAICILVYVVFVFVFLWCLSPLVFVTFVGRRSGVVLRLWSN